MTTASSLIATAADGRTLPIMHDASRPFVVIVGSHIVSRHATLENAKRAASRKNRT